MENSALNLNPEISVVVPVYYGESHLKVLCQRLRQSLEKISQNFEIILVNDGSPDDSWAIIKELVVQDKRVKGVNFSKNFGQHPAIFAGLAQANGQWIVVMDCDLQNPPEEIIKLYSKAQEGYDIVFGLRQSRKHNLLRRCYSGAFYWLLSYLTGVKQQAQDNFGIYSQAVIKKVLSFDETVKWFPLMVKLVGFNSVSIKVEHHERTVGKSSYTFFKLLKIALEVAITYSNKPLELIVKSGFIISFFSFIWVIFIVFRAFYGIEGVVGWPSLMASIWFVGGLIITFLGVIGIYLGKSFNEVKKRPIYIIKEIL